MLREKKTRIVEELADTLSRSAIIISTGYQGLSAKQMADLRRVLVSSGVEYRVIKNTLARLAAQKAGRDQVMDIIEGPTALAFGWDDVTTPAKLLDKYSKSQGLGIQIKGGILGERVLDASEISGLANLPSREVLIAQVVAGLQSPIRNLHNVLASPLQGLCFVLQARIQKLNE